MMRAISFLIAAALAGLAAPSLGQITPTSRHLTAISPDGRLRAVVSPVRPVHCYGDSGQGSSDNSIHQMEISELATNRYVTTFMGLALDPDVFRGISFFASPKFSPDATSIYFVARDTMCETETWRDNPRVYRIDMADMAPETRRAAREIAEGRLFAILQTGPRKGWLLILQKAKNGAADPVVLFSPDGQPGLTIPESNRLGAQAVEPWLKAQGWTAY